MELTSWSRVLNEEASLLLVELAEPGMSMDEWVEYGHDELPHARQGTRHDLIRTARPLIDQVDGRIIDSAFLRLFRDGSPTRRRELLWGRYLLTQKWMPPLLDELVLPRIAALEEPLAPHDADRASDEDFTVVLDRHLRAGTPDIARSKTHRVLSLVLTRVGVLEPDGDDWQVRRARPDVLAFSWLVAWQMRSEGMQEARAGWATQESFAARLFATDPDYARVCLDAGIAAGLMRRGYLAGHPRLHVGGAMEAP